MALDDDAETMARFVGTRDRRLFTMLFEKYERPMFAHVLRFVRNRATAEELTQEVFVRVYTTKRYRPEHPFRAWIYRVATNVCLNELRRGRHGAIHESLDATPDEASPGRELPSTEAGPDDALAGERLAARVSDRLDRLPPKQRAAFLMVRHDGLTHEEIATALDTSVSAVKSLVHRALDALRREVEAATVEPAREEVAS
ncbi:MAG: RNA polymerase sigma factor [Myxococcota bacterium]